MPPLLSGAIHGNILRGQAASNAGIERLAFPFFDAEQARAVLLPEKPAIQAFAVAGLILEITDFAAGLVLPLLALKFYGCRRVLAGIEFGQVRFGDLQIGESQLAGIQNPHQLGLRKAMDLEIDAAAAKLAA